MNTVKITIGEMISGLEALQESYGQETEIAFFNENTGSLMTFAADSLEESHEEMPNGDIRIYLMDEA